MLKIIGIDFFTSPYDLEAIDFVDKFVPAYKIGSGDITWLDAIEHMASKEKPILLATGASSMSEVDRAVSILRRRKVSFSVMQCNTNYTGDATNLQHINLRVLKTFGERFPDKLAAVMVHPIDAERLDINQGDCVEIANPRGRHTREAQVTDRTQPGLLVAEGIYWQNTQSGDSGINDLTSQEVTDYGEGGTFHESRVKLRRVAN